MNTRKYPRTLDEAFGPYTSHKIYDQNDFHWTPVRIALAITYAAALVTFMVVL